MIDDDAIVAEAGHPIPDDSPESDAEPSAARLERCLVPRAAQRDPRAARNETEDLPPCLELDETSSEQYEQRRDRHRRSGFEGADKTSMAPFERTSFGSLHARRTLEDRGLDSGLWTCRTWVRNWSNGDGLPVQFVRSDPGGRVRHIASTTNAGIGRAGVAGIGLRAAGTRFLPCALVPLIGIAARLAYGGGFLNFDSMWSVVWGGQIAHLDSPTFSAAGAVTPHPLTTLEGILLAPLGSDAETALHAVGYIGLGALVYATGLLAYRVFGLAAAIVAALLLFSREGVALYGTMGYLDFAFAALAVWAAALEVQRPRRGAAVLVLLAVAGLLRPEAWFLSAAYLAWLWSGLDRRPRPRLLALALSAPLLWGLADLAATGHPTYSFTFVREAARQLDRIVGLSGLVTHGPRMLGQELRPSIAVAGFVGFCLCVAIPRLRFLAAWLVIVAAVVSIPVLGGAPLLPRYLVTLVALVCVLAAGAMTGWTREGGRLRRTWALAASVTALLALVTLPAQERRLSTARDEVIAQTRYRTEARQALSDGVPCAPLTLPTPMMIPLVRVWNDIPLRSIRVVGARAPASGSYVRGSAAAEVALGRRPGEGRAPAPAGRSAQAHAAGPWSVTARCHG